MPDDPTARIAELESALSTAYARGVAQGREYAARVGDCYADQIKGAGFPEEPDWARVYRASLETARRIRALPPPEAAPETAPKPGGPAHD